MPARAFIKRLLEVYEVIEEAGEEGATFRQIRKGLRLKSKRMKQITIFEALMELQDREEIFRHRDRWYANQYWMDVKEAEQILQQRIMMKPFTPS